MINNDKDINEEISELNESISYFNVLVASNKIRIPDNIVLAIVSIFNKTANIMYKCIAANKESNEQLDRSLQICLTFIDQIRNLENENVELRKFIDVAKKFPGFNC